MHVARHLKCTDAADETFNYQITALIALSVQYHSFATLQTGNLKSANANLKSNRKVH